MIEEMAGDEYSDVNRETEGIHALIEKFAAAWNGHDAMAFALLFAKDADFTNIFGHKEHGRNDIESFHAGAFASVFKASTLSVTNISIRFFDTAMAAVDVAWQMDGIIDPKGNAVPQRNGLINMVMKHENGAWQIFIMHNMELPSA